VKISKQARREAKQLFASCCVKGLPDDAKVRRAVEAVIAGKPRGYLAILSHFQRLVKLDVERRTVRLETVIPLPPGQQRVLRENLTRQYGPGLDFAFSQNPDLIGGLRVQAGSDVFDGTIRARLAALEASFSSA
jgi:F-type H+-transporting ATPase subunit delta